ncbi:MAG: pitrilysin family protein [Acidobacteriota bacterium]
MILNVLFAAAAALAQQQTTPPPPAPPRPIAWPAITEKKLANGLTLVLAPLPNVPKVTLDFSFLAGRGAGGVAQLAGRVMLEGTATRSSKELKEELRSIGGEMGVNVDRDATSISASALSEFSPKLLDLVSDVARNASYPKSEVDLAKSNFASEIEEQRSSPEFVAGEQMAKAIFGAHPYGYTVPEPAAIGKVTREQLKQFAATRYLPNNAFLVVVGDFEPAAMTAAVEKAFGPWQRGTLPAVKIAEPAKRQKRQIVFVDRPGSVQSTIVVGALAPPRKAADYLALRTASIITGGAFYSRLTRNIRESKGYTYSPFSSADLRRLAGSFSAEASVRNEVTGPTILELLYELDRMRVTPVTDEELASAKTYSVGTMELELETQAGLAQRIATIYVYDLQHDFLQTFREKIEKLTAADIRRAAAKYYDTYRGAIVVVGDYGQVKDQVAPFGDVTLIKPK